MTVIVLYIVVNLNIERFAQIYIIFTVVRFVVD